MENEMNNRKCSLCNAIFRDSYNLYRHLTSVHGQTNKVFEFICDFCDRVFHQKSNLSSHLRTVHNEKKKNFGPWKPQRLNFISFTDFQEWKEKTEKETIAKFVKTSRNYTLKDGRKKTVFSCHRSGIYKSRGSGKRKTKVIGTNKINNHCPAKIICTFKVDGGIDILYFSKHIGHDMELYRIPLSKKERADIAKKIEARIPFEDILNEFNSSNEFNNVNRIQLLTKKDLCNIKREFSSNKEEIYDSHEHNNVVIENVSSAGSLSNSSDISPNKFEFIDCDDETSQIVECCQSQPSQGQTEESLRLDDSNNSLETDELETIKGEIFCDFIQVLNNIKNIEEAAIAKKFLFSLPALVKSLADVHESYDVLISVVSNESNNIDSK